MTQRFTGLARTVKLGLGTLGLLTTFTASSALALAPAQVGGPVPLRLAASAEKASSTQVRPESTSAPAVAAPRPATLAPAMSTTLSNADLEHSRQEVEWLVLFTETAGLEQARPLGSAEVLAQFDRDQDGLLNALEAKRAMRNREERKQLRLQLLMRYDSNLNGRFDAAEMARARSDSQATRRKSILRCFDKDADGVLDAKELAAMVDRRARVEQLARLMPRFDLDGTAN